MSETAASCHSIERSAASPPDFGSVLLIGNPNVGKSVLFGYLTGKYATVSNYPGTTVEISRGEGVFHHRRTVVVDTPGVNSLMPQSEDERVTRDILLSSLDGGVAAGAAPSVIQVADAKNFSRALLLSLEMAELGVPLVLALNMQDEAMARGLDVDREGIAAALGVPVMETIAVQRKGLAQVVENIPKAAVPRLSVTYPRPVEEAVEELLGVLPPGLRSRGLALMTLTEPLEFSKPGKKYLVRETIEKIRAIRERAERRYNEPLASLISRTRVMALEPLVRRCLRRREAVPPDSFAAAAGRLAMHPVWGFGVLGAILFAVWWFVGVFGAGTLVGLIENTVFGEYINPAAIWFFQKFIPIPLIQELFVGEYGVITMGVTYSVAIILPIVATFFLAFGLLEDSGYLARLAVMMNRTFRAMGLNGKAVLPMVLGLGCDTMATMTTRILETRKERIITTLLLVLAVPCSAQLGVIMAMMAALPAGALLLWLGVVLGVLVTVGWLAARVLPGKTSDFVLEVPPIRRPTLRNIAVKTLGRVEWYLKEAVPLFLLGTALLFVFDKLHVLNAVRRAGAPMVQGFLGLPPESMDAFVMGFLRRDFGAAGFFAMLEAGRLAPAQALVSVVVITLFMPCVANLMMAVKELGNKTAALITVFVFAFAFMMGGVLNAALHWGGWFQ
jgi:ferrous iron transport protein B